MKRTKNNQQQQQQQSLAKRIRLLAPLPSVPNNDISLLYHILVPHGNTCGIEYGFVDSFFQLEEISYATYGDYESWAKIPANIPRVAWAIDVLQLALTCRHAFASLHVTTLCHYLKKLTQCWMNNIIYNGMRMVGLMARRLDPYFRNYGATITPPLFRSILAAYVGREAVAQSHLPQELTLNCAAFRALAPDAPEWQDGLRPSEFEKQPLIWFNPAGLARLQKEQVGKVDRARQWHCWLLLAYAHDKTYTAGAFFQAIKHASFRYKFFNPWPLRTVKSDSPFFRALHVLTSMRRNKITTAKDCKAYIKRVEMAVMEKEEMAALDDEEKQQSVGSSSSSSSSSSIEEDEESSV